MIMPQLTVIDGNRVFAYEVNAGDNLRRTLIRCGHSPYTRLTRYIHCRGNGLCATCGVWLLKGVPEPRHWHDALAARWGYARLSCQVSIQADMTVALDREKIIWGHPRKDGRSDSSTSDS